MTQGRFHAPGVCVALCLALSSWACSDDASAPKPTPTDMLAVGGTMLPSISGEGLAPAAGVMNHPAPPLTMVGGAEAVSADGGPGRGGDSEPDGPPGPFEPCTDGDECLSGYCIPGPDGQRVCSQLCGDDDDCPPEWECLAVANTRPDTVLLCVARRQSQCLACAHDGDCGSGIDRCIDIGRSKRCARSCETEECREGSTCATVELEGEMVQLCLPDDGTCEPCVDMDGDGYGNTGDCDGLDCDDDNPLSYEGAVEVCDGLDNDCDTIPDEEIPDDPELYASDVNNCGQCGSPCTNDNGETACVHGLCAPTCADLFGDCNENLADGCETPINTASHCGVCGVVCALPNASESCETGACLIEACDEGYGDCDFEMPEATGCEVDLNADIANCGRCGERCINPNGGAACRDGACAVTCAPGFDDCDRNVATGCEQSLSDLIHCGACGANCELEHAEPLCQDQSCVRAACDQGWCDPEDDITQDCAQLLDTDPGCGQASTELEAIDGDRGSHRREVVDFGEKTFRIRVNEARDACRDTRVQVTLEKPPEAEYGLEVWCENDCQGPGRQENHGPGGSEEVVIKWDESCFLGFGNGDPDGGVINVRVRYVRANTCEPWRLVILGNNGSDGFRCN